LQYAAAAMKRGETVAMFIFDEELGILFRRSKAVGTDLEKYEQAGMLIVDQIDAAEVSPGQFSHRVRRCVDDQSVAVVVIDSLNGYYAAMPEERSLTLHIHELLQYLNRRGTSTFLTVAQHGLIGLTEAPIDVTYLADTVVLLRYFEQQGCVRRAISVIKKRTGAHENTVREFQIGSQGLRVGPVLKDFDGILQGFPTLARYPEPIMKD
jgi:circadian clock protein KaiC